MNNIITNNFKLHLSNQFIESFTESANTVYYLFVSNHLEYPIDDNTIPVPVDNIKTVRSDITSNMIFGKKISPNDISLMIKRSDWTANTVYDKYLDNSDLYKKKYYATANAGSYYYVYKVLDNAGGSPSTVSPISSTDESACNFITTGDGYKWKLMYKIGTAQYGKFATPDYIPITTSDTVRASAVDGSLDVIEITYPGSGYIVNFAGQFRGNDLRDAIPTLSGNTLTYRLGVEAATNSSFYTGSAIYLNSGTGSGQLRTITDYDSQTRVIVIDTAFAVPPDATTSYVLSPAVQIKGDGISAQAYATISSNATVKGYIDSIVITDRGSKYSYATATITGNTGGVSNTATCRVTIPPKGGHGFEPFSELGASKVCISVSANNTEGGYITAENDFRTIGIIKDPLFSNIKLYLSNKDGGFNENEIACQFDYKPLKGVVATTAGSPTVTGTGTDFIPSLKPGDKVLLSDQININNRLCTVAAVTNSVSLTLTSNVGITSNVISLSYASIIANCVITADLDSYITVSNAEPKFTLNKKVIGLTTGAVGTVSNIIIRDKPYNSWSFFDNRISIDYGSVIGSFVEDLKITQGTDTAYYHSSNNTHIFLTNEVGSIEANPARILISQDSLFEVRTGIEKYSSDIVEGSGSVLYIENGTPIQRSNTQSELFRLVLDF